MRVAGFSFIKNAILNDYPIVEAIRSALPLCDAFYVAVGKSDDETEALIRGMDEAKIHIIPTIWDESQREGGHVLAKETDKAFAEIPLEFDWCVYIQGDEVLHEAGHAILRKAMEKHVENPKIEAFLLKYHHFYGSYDFVGASRKWYRREIRIIRNDKKIKSYRDAQGFRYEGKRKLKARLVDAYMHHYGWVRHPEAQQRKQASFNKLWHSDEEVKRRVGEKTAYIYDGNLPIKRFEGTHPEVMKVRIETMNWNFEGRPEAAKQSLQEAFLSLIEEKTGWRIGEYRNYVEV